MTIDEIEDRVRRIEAMAGDDEAAHSAEDALRDEVLSAIAYGRATDPAGCARAALKTNDISFARWCA